MRKPGQIVLFRFPQTDQFGAKIRPALLIGRLPGAFNDWLLCMISSQLRHHVQDFDEIVHENSEDFAASGLKASSLVKVGRLAVVDETIMMGAVGEIGPERMKRIKSRLANWILST